MNQAAFGRWLGRLIKNSRVPAPPAVPPSATPPPERSVELLWTGPGLGSVAAEGL